MRRKRRRHKAVDDAVPDLAFVGDERSLVRDVVDKLCSSTCKGLLKPAAPVKPKGSMPLTLRFECGSRDADISVRTGDKMRLYAQPEALPKEVDTDEEANEPKPARCRGRATLVAATPWRRIGASDSGYRAGAGSAKTFSWRTRARAREAAQRAGRRLHAHFAPTRGVLTARLGLQPARAAAVP